MVLSVATEKIPSDITGNQSRDRPTVAQYLNHYATPGVRIYRRQKLLSRRECSPVIGA
jgi:hypothetical protein